MLVSQTLAFNQAESIGIRHAHFKDEGRGAVPKCIDVMPPLLLSSLRTEVPRRLDSLRYCFPPLPKKRTKLSQLSK